MKTPSITVFTKPWPELPVEQLADLVASLGFDGIELPIRPGFQVEPENMKDELPKAAAIFRDLGLAIQSVATDLTPEAIEACAEAGVPILRTMLSLDPELSYFENVDAFRQQCEGLMAATAGSGVSIGLQNHCDRFASSAVSIMQAIEPLGSDHVSAVLDLGHTGLDGELEDIAIDVCWSRLSMVNLKNSVRERTSVEEGVQQWRRKWVPGKDGITNWDKGIEELGKRNYTGPICITAEYADDNFKPYSGDAILPYLKEDMDYLKHLIGKYYA